MTLFLPTEPIPAPIGIDWIAPMPANHGPRWNRELSTPKQIALVADTILTHGRKFGARPRNVAEKGNVVPRLACGPSRRADWTRCKHG